jgi:hypothetical protein
VCSPYYTTISRVKKKAGTTPMATQLDLARVWADFSLLFL